MPHLLVFGLGYSASRLAERLRADGWRITATRRSPTADAIAFDDLAAVRSAIASATHILSSVPPAESRDPVLEVHRDALAAAPAAWIGYLSSTGVYGDTGGAWVDEGSPHGGRRTARADADRAWVALRPEVRVFRLPGIYGPGRSPLDRVRSGQAHRIDLPGQVFSRVHVDDIVSGVAASFAEGPPGAYNLADDLPASQNAVIEFACNLIGVTLPPLLSLEAAGLSDQARAFYSENRRVANGKARRLLGWAPAFPDYRAGLRALSATTSPTRVNAAPAPAWKDQR